MNEHEELAREFEAHRERLQGVAYRMLGSLTEADDAVQEAWLRLSRSDASSVENLGGWLTTVVARVCLDMLRSRKSRGEEPLETQATDRKSDLDPEREALLADSVGLALLVVLDTLAPAERLAFVMHDMFGVSFEEIAPIVGRTPMAARQLASRARRRVQGAATPNRDLDRQRDAVNAFLAALRAGDLEGMMTVLDPEFMVRSDVGPRLEIHGAREWAKSAIAFGRGAKFARPALINGNVGVVVAPQGRLFRVLSLTFRDGKIAQMEVIGDPDRLAKLDLGVIG
jgi:RNA polymerase sigma-70 factor, ECF subfamily